MLIVKLQSCRIGGYSLKILAKYPTHPFQKAKIENDKREQTKFSRGVPQGSILGARMLLMDANDWITSGPKRGAYGNVESFRVMKNSEQQRRSEKNQPNGAQKPHEAKPEQKQNIGATRAAHGLRVKRPSVTAFQKMRKASLLQLLNCSCRTFISSERNKIRPRKTLLAIFSEKHTQRKNCC